MPVVDGFEVVCRVVFRQPGRRQLTRLNRSLCRSADHLKPTLQAAISRLLMCASSIFGALCSNNATEVGQFSEAIHTASSDQSSCVSQKKVDVDEPVRPLCITF